MSRGDAVEPGSATPLIDAVTKLMAVPEDERQRLVSWLQGEPEWRRLALGRLDTRLDVVRRLSFHREPGLLAHHSQGRGS